VVERTVTNEGSGSPANLCSFWGAKFAKFAEDFRDAVRKTFVGAAQSALRERAAETFPTRVQ